MGTRSGGAGANNAVDQELQSMRVVEIASAKDAQLPS